MAAKISILLVFLILLLRPLKSTIADPDLWGYLSFGRLYWETGRFPYQDVFTYLPTLNPWVYHEWLTGIIYYAIYNGIGEAGLILLRYGVSFLTLILIYLIARKRGANRVSSFILLAYTSWFLRIGNGSVLRAAVFTYLFFALTLYLLENYRWTARVRYLWMLIPLQIFWCNLHGGFPAGLGLIALYGVGEALSGRSFRHYTLIFLLSVISTLVNPYGFQYWDYIYRAIAMPRPEIIEWASIFESYETNFLSSREVFYFLFIILAPIRWIQVVRWREITPIIILIFTLYLGITHIRHMVFFLIAAGAFLPAVAQQYFAQIKFHPLDIIFNFLKARAAVFSTPLLLVIMIPILFINPVSFSLKVPPLPADEHMYYPVGAIYYLHRNNISGNLLTEFGWGEYLIWTLNSNLRVGLDGRYETVYPDSVGKEYFDFIYGRDERFLDRYPHEMALLHPDTRGLKFLKKRREWHQIYADAGCVLLAYEPDSNIMQSDMNPSKGCHSRESGNPGKDWIPEPPPYLIRGQARNDQRENINVVLYNHRKGKHIYGNTISRDVYKEGSDSNG
jgi:hypothetical protein